MSLHDTEPVEEIEPGELTVEDDTQPPAHVGQIVLYRIGLVDDLVRPAVVTHLHDDDMGGVALHMFARPNDVPFAHGTAIRADSIMGYYVDRALHGDDLGQWRYVVDD